MNSNLYKNEVLDEEIIDITQLLHTIFVHIKLIIFLSLLFACGGFFGTNGNTEEQNAGSYVGGFVSNQTNQAQGVGYESISTTDEYDSKKLPVKAGFWSRIKSFLFQEIDLKQEIRIELSPKEEKVLNEVHDFLFQEVSFKGFKRSLKNNK